MSGQLSGELQRVGVRRVRLERALKNAPSAQKSTQASIPHVRGRPYELAGPPTAAEAITPPGERFIERHPRPGHAGAGGSLGFADPECRMSFGYAMNRMGQGILLQDREQALVDAAYRSLGYDSTRGCWHRRGDA